ncbi:hypothetical protein C8R45DRAFT_1179816 [Mycena sanguinolenta]|nr:hypothetical protein C8R45DRAFT_1179816 [Mycena sanguinolenta]
MALPSYILLPPILPASLPSALIPTFASLPLRFSLFPSSRCLFLSFSASLFSRTKLAGDHSVLDTPLLCARVFYSVDAGALLLGGRGIKRVASPRMETRELVWGAGRVPFLSRKKFNASGLVGGANGHVEQPEEEGMANGYGAFLSSASSNQISNAISRGPPASLPRTLRFATPGLDPAQLGAVGRADGVQAGGVGRTGVDKRFLLDNSYLCSKFGALFKSFKYRGQLGRKDGLFDEPLETFIRLRMIAGAVRGKPETV